MGSFRYQAAAVLFVTVLSLSAQTQEQIELSENGQALMGQGKFAEAIPIYRQLSQAMPANPGLLLNLGMALNLAGQSRQAVSPLEKAVKLDGNVPPAWLFLGASYLAAGQAGRALLPLKNYIRLQPEDPGGHQTFGDALLATGAYRDAAAEYRELSTLEVNNPRAWYGLNRCYTALAQTVFDGIAKDAPQSVWWFALVADERYLRRQFASAFFFYKKAQAIQPDLAGLHASIAEVYKATGHPDWAAAELRKEVQPNCAEQRQACDFASGQYDQVIAKAGTTSESSYWLARAYGQLARNASGRLEQLPEGPEIHELRAEISEARRQHKEAVSEWNLALKYAPQDPHLREELLTSLLRAQEYPAALTLVEELLQGDPASPSLNLTKGYALLGSAQAEKAIPCLRAALKTEPKLLPAHSALGQAYLLSNQPAAAIPHLVAALPIDEDGSCRYSLSKAYQATGRVDLAKKTIGEYQAWQKADREEKQRLEQEMQITAP